MSNDPLSTSGDPCTCATDRFGCLVHPGGRGNEPLFAARREWWRTFLARHRRSRFWRLVEANLKARGL